MIARMDLVTVEQRFRTRWGGAGLVLAYGGLGLALTVAHDDQARLTWLLFLVISVFGAFLAFLCGLAHPSRRVKFPLILGSLAYFALGYQVVMAPALGT
jgi:hypothetical protein